jgi:glycosyltransferase involved in cell wall biosynthesis
MKPYLSVLIPTCNRNIALGKCLDLLKEGVQLLAFDQYEVIVTDDGPAFDAEKFIEINYSWVKYTRGAQKGPAANRNNGARLAEGKWLVFTDDDCLPDPGWLFTYLNMIKKYPECKAFEGAILPDDWELFQKPLAECPVNTGGNCFWSANIMVEKQLFNTLGGFDEQFMIAAQEDKDLKNRLAAHTFIPFLKEALVIHPVRVINFRKKMKKIPGEWRNWMKYVNKQDKAQRFGLIINSLKNHSILMLRAFTKLQLKTCMLHGWSMAQYLLLPITFRRYI